MGDCLHVCVAQLVELQPKMLKVVGSSPTQGSNFSVAVFGFDLYVFVLSFSNVRVFIVCTVYHQLTQYMGDSCLYVHVCTCLIYLGSLTLCTMMYT